MPWRDGADADARGVCACCSCTVCTVASSGLCAACMLAPCVPACGGSGSRRRGRAGYRELRDGVSSSIDSFLPSSSPIRLLLAFCAPRLLHGTCGLHEQGELWPSEMYHVRGRAAGGGVVAAQASIDTCKPQGHIFCKLKGGIVVLWQIFYIFL